MKIVYVVKKDGKIQADMGTHSTHQKAEDSIYRHVTNQITKSGKPFHEAVRSYEVRQKVN